MNIRLRLFHTLVKSQIRRIPMEGDVLMCCSSKCFGDSNSGAKRWLREEGFEELFQLLVLHFDLSIASC